MTDTVKRASEERWMIVKEFRSGRKLYWYGSTRKPSDSWTDSPRLALKFHTRGGATKRAAEFDVRDGSAPTDTFIVERAP